jgi:transposase
MTILTRQERERLVLDLYYNQGKTYREISKEARISPRDIGIILNRTIRSKAEGSKEEQDNINSKNDNQEQQQHLSLFAQAYKLFSDRKTPLEVAIALNLRESEATKFCKDYWKLKLPLCCNSLLYTGNNIISEYYMNPFIPRVQADKNLCVVIRQY